MKRLVLSILLLTKDAATLQIQRGRRDKIFSDVVCKDIGLPVVNNRRSTSTCRCPNGHSTLMSNPSGNYSCKDRTELEECGKYFLHPAFYLKSITLTYFSKNLFLTFGVFFKLCVPDYYRVVILRYCFAKS